MQQCSWDEPVLGQPAKADNEIYGGGDGTKKKETEEFVVKANKVCTFFFFF